MKHKFSRLITALIFLLAVSIVGSIAYGNDEIPPPEQSHWKGMSGKEAGKALLVYRKNGDNKGFASHFFLFINQGRSKSEILSMLNVIRIPLLDSEVSALEEVYLDAVEFSNPPFVDNAFKNGYSLECHGTPGTRFSLVFLNQEEREVYRKKQEEGISSLNKREEKVWGNLEGRLCVWAPKRKIHLGGPHFVFDRVKNILLHGDKDLD